MKYLLRIGVCVAALLILLGGIYFLIENGTAPARYGSENVETQKEGIFFINLGIIVLSCIPLICMLLAFIIYAFKKDILYAALSFVVAALLTYSLMIGFGIHFFLSSPK